MASESGRAPAPVAEDLRQRPHRFEFYQAVRLLEQMLPGRAEVGRDADPSAEVVRFRSDVTLLHPVSDVTRVDVPDPDSSEPARLDVSFMGVATPASFGSLPLPYSEIVVREPRERDGAPPRRPLGDFLDLFNHRFISLLYRAWKRARLAPSYEFGETNFFEQTFRGVLGLATPHLTSRLPLDERALFSRAGLLAMAPAPALAIEALLESYLQAPAHIEPFISCWYRVEEDQRSRLGRCGTRLGADLCLGSEVRMTNTRFRVRLGPLPRALYDELLPDRRGHDVLCALVRMACGNDLDFEVQLVLRAEDIAAVRLESELARPAELGRSMWLREGPVSCDRDDAVFLGSDEPQRRAA